MRKPYYVVAPLLQEIEVRMVESHLALDSIGEMDARAEYLDLLKCTGWSEKDFDNETLKRIDRGWDIVTPSPRGTHPMVLAAPSSGLAGIPHWKIRTSNLIH